MNASKEETNLSVNLNPGSYSGFVLDSFEDKIVVSKVEPGSPAEKAGIVEGLAVASVNGKPTADWTLARVQQEIEGATQPLKIQLSKSIFEAGSTHSTSQRSSKYLGTDDEGSQSTGSQSSVININSTLSADKTFISVPTQPYSSSTSEFNRPVVSIQTNYESKNITNLTAASVTNSATVFTGAQKTALSNADNLIQPNSCDIKNAKLNINTTKCVKQDTSATECNFSKPPNSNSATGATLVDQSNPNSTHTKTAEYAPTFQSKTTIITKPDNSCASTTLSKQTTKTVTYTPDTSAKDSQANNVQLTASKLSSSRESNTTNNVSEITSSYWPAGTLITVEQQMELERKQRIESESLYSKVVHKDKSMDNTDNAVMPQSQPSANSNSTAGEKASIKESIYNEIKITPDSLPRLTGHDLTQVSSDLTHDVAKIEVESALNEDGRRRSKSVPVPEIKSETVKDGNVPLSRKSSSVDRKISNHSSFGKSFFSRIFGSQKKQKDPKPNKTTKILTKNVKNSSYETLGNVVSEPKTNSQKNEVIKHAETYLVVERGKKINKLQSRDSMTSMEENSSCMPACVCLSSKSKRSNSFRIANKSPEFQKSSKPFDINTANKVDNDFNKPDLKLAYATKPIAMESIKVTNNLNLNSEPTIKLDELDHRSTEIVVENALKEQTTPYNVRVPSRSIEHSFKTVESISNTMTGTTNICTLGTDTAINVADDNSNSKKYSEKDLGTCVTIEKAIFDKPDIQKTNVDVVPSMKVDTNLRVNRPVISLETKKNTYKPEFNVDQINSESVKKSINKPVISPKPLAINIKKEAAFNFKPEILEKDLKIDISKASNSDTEVQLLQQSCIQSKQDFTADFEMQNPNSTNIYDNPDMSAMRKQVISNNTNKKVVEGDYDTIDIVHSISDNHSKTNDINKYIIDSSNRNKTNPQFNSYTLPSFKIRNEAALKDNKITSMSNINEGIVPHSPIYDVPSFNSDINVYGEGKIRAPNFNSNLQSFNNFNDYDNKENINNSAFQQSRFGNLHSINISTKNSQMSANNASSKMDKIDEVFATQTENIYEKIQLSPEINKKDNHDVIAIDKKSHLSNAFKFENAQKQLVKPSKNLNDLVLPVYTRLNPNLLHEVVKPEPIKPGHLNLNKINYSHFEKKDPPKNVEEILNELLSTSENSSPNPPKISHMHDDNPTTDFTHENDYDNKINVAQNITYNNNSRNDSNMMKIAQSNAYEKDNLQRAKMDLPQKYPEQIAFHTIANQQPSQKEHLNEYKSSKSTLKEAKFENIDVKNVQSDCVDSSTDKADQSSLRYNHDRSDGFSQLRFNLQKVDNIQPSMYKKISTSNMDQTNNNIQSNSRIDNEFNDEKRVNIAKGIQHLDERHADLINNSSVNRTSDRVNKFDWSKEKLSCNNEIHLEARIHSPKMIIENRNEPSHLKSYIPKVVVTGPSPHSTLNIKIEQNESMAEKQKRKKYRLRLCVDPTALRSWIVH